MKTKETAVIVLLALALLYALPSNISLLAILAVVVFALLMWVVAVYLDHVNGY